MSERSTGVNNKMNNGHFTAPGFKVLVLCPASIVNDTSNTCAFPTTTGQNVGCEKRSISFTGDQ